MAGFGVDRGSGSSSGNPDSTISESLIDAKGDLIVGTADNTAGRLAVGANETRLVADSAEATGLKWVADSVNYLIAAAGDIIYGTAADTAARLAIGAAKRRLAVNAGATAPEWVADTQNTVVDAKGDLLVGTAADTVAALTVGTDDQVLIADSAEATGIRWGDAPTNTSPHRQTQLSGALDSSGYNATLSAGAGLNFNVDATPTNAIYSFAGGFNAAGASDLVTVLSADASNQGSLNASNTHYIHATRTSPTAVTWGQALIPPQYGYAFDRTEGALLNFEAADASTTFADDFGNTWAAAGNAQVDTAQSKFGSASLLCDGTGDYAECTNITSLGGGSWTIEMFVRFNALPASGQNMLFFAAENASNFGVQLGLNNSTGTYRINLALSSNGTANDLANGLLGDSSSFTTGTWYHIAVVYDALAGKYFTYVDGVEDETVTSTSRICAITRVRLGNGGLGTTILHNGWLDAFRFIRACIYANGATFTPPASAPAITDYPVHFFSIPEMKMYEVTAASAGAGSNPTMTQRTRLFVGECDTDGSSVTATRNYALRGEYESNNQAWAAAAQETFNHNIGVIPRDIVVTLENRTNEGGFRTGDRVVLSTNDNATNSTSVVARRNALYMNLGTGMPTFARQDTFARVTAATTHWVMNAQASRGW